ncbi:hypothetical protein CAEBREN_00013 [Caenorhabditis brenneri]|uniref:Serpentine Receptor, class H n=1 Tax=Caenorhabditis brenneri TaxID=135651 RepID=G0N0P9_CAEBE|nr:hypothetical protein CAEBREN_00013 [Caenorhabditis brenneri]
MSLKFLSVPNTFSNILYLVSAFSAPVHIFGAFCILSKTPIAMHSVKWCLFNLHFWSMTLDLSLSFFGQPFICTPAFAGISLGLFHKLISTSILTYLFMTIFMFVVISIVAIFENRYFLLFAQHTWWQYGRYPFLVVNYLIGIVYYIPTHLQVPEQTEARKELFIKLPKLLEYDTPENPIFVSAFDNPWITYRQGIVTVLISAEILIFVGLLNWKMRQAMKRMTLSEKTLRLQSEFIKALKLQIAIPLVIILIPSLVLAAMGISGYQNQGANNLVFLVTSVHGMCSTLLMLYLQKPYRDYCRTRFSTVSSTHA